MKNFSRAAVAAICLAVFANAHATVYTVNFTATDFTFGEWGAGPPQTLVQGSITFTAASLDDAPAAVNAIDLTINGHTYTVDDISSSMYWGSTNFGAVNHDGGFDGELSSETDDFRLSFGNAWPGGGSFTYTAKDYDNFYTADYVTTTITEQADAAIPEPGSLGLLAGGIAAMGVRRRRHGKQAN